MGCSLMQYRASIGYHCGGCIGDSMYYDYKKLSMYLLKQNENYQSIFVYKILFMLIMCTCSVELISTKMLTMYIWLHSQQLVLLTRKVINKKSRCVGIYCDYIRLFLSLKYYLLLYLILSGDVHPNPGPHFGKTNIVMYSNNVFHIILLSLLNTCGDVHPNPGPSTLNHNCLSICHSNIRSINVDGKLDHIKIDLTEFDIITLSETWLKPSIPTTQFKIDNYNLPFRKDRSDNSGYGGVMAWVNSNILCKRRLDLEHDSYELMWLELKLLNVKILLGIIYRPPNTKRN